MLIRVTGQERQLPRCLCEKLLFCQLAVADNQSEYTLNSTPLMCEHSDKKPYSYFYVTFM
jgi:hypothetical protein